MFIQEFVTNGQTNGPVGDTMAGCRWEPGLMRPYFDERGRRCVTVNAGMVMDQKKGIYVPKKKKVLIGNLMERGIYSPVFNATTLRKDEWIKLDTAVRAAARERLRAWADLAAANPYGGFDGMASTILEYENMNDPGEAVVDMDGLGQGRGDNPMFKREGLPLPITHSDFWFSERQLAVSRNRGTPLNMLMAEASARRVAEKVEKTLIGMATGITYGTAANYNNTPRVWGYTNHPDRITKTDVTAPTTEGWKPSTLLHEVLEMRQLLYDDKHYGPYMLYHSADWDTYLDDDYYALATSGMAAPSQTLRNRIRQTEGIQDVRRLDFFTDDFSLLMVQMTKDVAQAVIGMDITTMQWESQGGMRKNFKVMCIMVPELTSDYNAKSGICHGTIG